VDKYSNIYILAGHSLFMDLDKKSSSILSVLRSDGRASIRDVAKKTRLRPSTVHQRMKKLQKEGVIERFTVKLDDSKVGEGLVVIMLVKTKPGVMLDKVFNADEVKAVYGVTGEYDLMVKLKFKDVAEFNEFVLHFRKQEEVESTLTMVATATIKESI